MKLLVDGIEVEYLNEPVLVYNFEVEDFHTYYVSGLGILVHNMCMVAGDSKTDFYVTPEGVAIPQVNYHSLSDLDARKWYLSQEATIPDLIDYSQPLKQQAYQAFSLRNKFRTTARELMANRELAESLYITDPNPTWEEIIQKQINKGLTGDDIYKSIMQSSQRSRTSVNKSLGLE